MGTRGRGRVGRDGTWLTRCGRQQQHDDDDDDDNNKVRKSSPTGSKVFAYTGSIYHPTWMQMETLFPWLLHHGFTGAWIEGCIGTWLMFRGRQQHHDDDDDDDDDDRR